MEISWHVAMIFQGGGRSFANIHSDKYYVIKLLESLSAMGKVQYSGNLKLNDTTEI